MTVPPILEEKPDNSSKLVYLSSAHPDQSEQTAKNVIPASSLTRLELWANLIGTSTRDLLDIAPHLTIRGYVKNLERIQVKINEMYLSRGIENDYLQLPSRLAIPLFHHASFEDEKRR